jgi:hypothetical protein
MRNRRLFDLARRLKAIIPNAAPDELRRIVSRWHRLALSKITTKSFPITWGEFLTAWKNVRIPHGSHFDQIVKKSISSPPPVEAANYGEDPNMTNNMTKLLSLCYQLHKHHNGGSWPLACRIIELNLSIKRTEANTLLGALMFDGIIERVKSGSYRDRQAAEYRWLGREKGNNLERIKF